MPAMLKKERKLETVVFFIRKNSTYRKITGNNFRLYELYCSDFSPFNPLMLWYCALCVCNLKQTPFSLVPLSNVPSNTSCLSHSCFKLKVVVLSFLVFLFSTNIWHISEQKDFWIMSNHTQPFKSAVEVCNSWPKHKISVFDTEH